MQKRVLALGLAATMSTVVLADLALAVMLASTHKSYVPVVASLTATIPGFVIAVLAWRGKLPTNCAR